MQTNEILIVCVVIFVSAFLQKKYGFVSFQRKSVCAMSGAVKMENVNYDPATKSFVSAEGQSVQSEVDARSINAATEAATEGVEKPKCCAKGAKSSCQKSAEQK